MTYACLPPFNTVCIMVFTALIGVLLSLRAAGPADPDPANRRQLHPRFWTWAALYFLFIAALYAGLLLLGIAIDP